ncbi:hypothetical protein VNO77_26015 [Canavalia gladiata]|uniref:Uncharacterized protein n=1 Tax=Canavalia gladiata TaxID=3824 RepID=A0AAN9Q558_CANGL
MMDLSTGRAYKIEIFDYPYNSPTADLFHRLEISCIALTVFPSTVTIKWDPRADYDPRGLDSSDPIRYSRFMFRYSLFLSLNPTSLFHFLFHDFQLSSVLSLGSALQLNPKTTMSSAEGR